MSIIKQYNILSVDDEPEITEVLRDILEPHYKVYPATSAEKAWDTLEAEDIDLILLDVKLPSISGFRLCEELKQHELFKTIPVIFVTAHYDPQQIKRGYRLGANDYMGKPFIKEEVLAKVKVHLRYGELFKIESIAS